MKAAVMASKDVWITGSPLLVNGEILDALHALYYLPENYKLILPGSHTADEGFMAKFHVLIARDNLHNRVQFTDDAPGAAIEFSETSVKGSSPEALASAILDLAHNRS